MDSKKKETERVESVCNGLKTQVESLREELKATQKAFRDKMDLSLAKLDGEWTEKMEKLKEEHAVSAPLSHLPSPLLLSTSTRSDLSSCCRSNFSVAPYIDDIHYSFHS